MVFASNRALLRVSESSPKSCTGKMNLPATPLLMILFSISACGFAKARPDFCNLDKEPGRCMAYFPRFYFDRHSDKCKQFIYGGCEGNQNNFEKLDDCQKTCGEKELK